MYSIFYRKTTNLRALSPIYFLDFCTLFYPAFVDLLFLSLACRNHAQQKRKKLTFRKCANMNKIRISYRMGGVLREGLISPMKKWPKYESELIPQKFAYEMRYNGRAPSALSVTIFSF